jgi:hypothetical protein
MNRRTTAICSCALATTLAASVSAGSTLTGFCYTDRIEKPVAGALVALYGSDDLLVSSTYSTNAGSFTLVAPDSAGKYYLIVTSGSRSSRADFQANPGKPLPAIHVVFHEGPASWLAYLKYVWNKVDYLATAALGFLVGLATKRLDNWRLLRGSTARMAEACGEVTVRYSSLKRLLAAWLDTLPGASDRDDLRAKWQLHIGHLTRALDELDAARPDATVVYDVKRSAGLDDLRKLRATIEQIRTLASEGLDTMGKINPAEIDAKLQPFKELATNPLVKG